MTNKNSGRKRSRNHGGKGVFGHLVQRNKNRTVRNLLQSVGSIRLVANEQNHETFKMKKIRNIVCRYNVELLSLSEVSKDWRKVSTKIRSEEVQKAGEINV